MAISGRVPLLMLVGVIPTILWPAPLAVLGWLLLVSALVAVDLALALGPQQLQLQRDLPASVRLSQPADSRLTVTNPTNRGARLQLRDAWPPSARPAGERPRVLLRAGESLRQTTRLLPSRRGDLAAGGVTVRSFGPLGLAARQHTVAVPGVLRVLPEFRSRSHLPYRLARLRELDGQASVHVRGQGTEFDSLREYAIGDDVRSIDWRASARATRTMVRTWRPERDRHILIVLDTSRWAAGRLQSSTGPDQTRLDAGIETCLLMAALGAASGDRMSLLVADQQLRLRLPGTGKGSVLPAFANGLSQIEPVLGEPDWTLIAEQVGQLCRQRSLVILVTGLDPALYADGVGTVLAGLSQAHQVLIAHVTDPGTTVKAEAPQTATEAYDLAAGSRLWLGTQGLVQRVGRLGVDVVQADPDALAPAVCDRYLALKAAGRL